MLNLTCIAIWKLKWEISSCFGQTNKNFHLRQVTCENEIFHWKKISWFCLHLLTKTTVLCCYGLMLCKRNYPKTRQHYPLDKSRVNYSQKYAQEKKGKKKNNSPKLETCWKQIHSADVGTNISSRNGDEWLQGLFPLRFLHFVKARVKLFRQWSIYHLISFHSHEWRIFFTRQSRVFSPVFHSNKGCDSNFVISFVK